MQLPFEFRFAGDRWVPIGVSGIGRSFLVPDTQFVFVSLYRLCISSEIAAGGVPQGVHPSVLPVFAVPAVSGLGVPWLRTSRACHESLPSATSLCVLPSARCLWSVEKMANGSAVVRLPVYYPHPTGDHTGLIPQAG